MPRHTPTAETLFIHGHKGFAFEILQGLDVVTITPREYDRTKLRVALTLALVQDVYLQLPAFYQKKRDMFLDLIRPSRFKPLACQGTYFQMLDYSDISDQPDMAFAEWMTVEKKVAAIPPSVFYNKRDDHKVLRFCFAKKDDTLKKAANILCKI